MSPISRQFASVRRTRMRFWRSWMRPPCAIVTMLPSWFHQSSLGFKTTENPHLVRQETSPVNKSVDVILVVLVFSYPFLKYSMFLCVIIPDTHTIMIRIYHNMTFIYIHNDIILYNYLTHDIQNSESMIFFPSKAQDFTNSFTSNRTMCVTSSACVVRSSA